MSENQSIQAIVFKKINNNYKYLLLRRIKSRGGFWQPITGRVEKGETFLEAVKRELKEETGISQVKRIIENIYEFSFNTGILNKELAFGVDINTKKNVKLNVNIYPEHDKIKWCSYKEAIKLLKWDGNKKALENLNTLLTKE